jgi:hypothetical protein
MMKIYVSIKGALVALSFAGMAMVSSQAFAGYGTITLSPGTLPVGTAGSFYSQTLTPSYGNGNYNFSVTGNTDGLVVTNPAAGTNLLVSGTPTTAGSFNFTIFGSSSNHAFIGGYNSSNPNSNLSNGQTFALNVSGGGGAPEIDGSLAPKVGFLLGCLFLMFGRKKQNTEPMMTA